MHTLSLPRTTRRTPLDIDPIRQTLHIAHSATKCHEFEMSRYEGHASRRGSACCTLGTRKLCLSVAYTILIHRGKQTYGSFYQFQSDICSWSPTWPRVLPDPNSLAHLPDGILPNLSALDTIDYMLKVFQRRPIEFFVVLHNADIDHVSP